MIIDPPVSRFSAPEEIERWLDRLQDVHATTEPGSDDRLQVDASIRDAERWLAASRQLASAVEGS